MMEQKMVVIQGTGLKRRINDFIHTFLNDDEYRWPYVTHLKWMLDRVSDDGIVVVGDRFMAYQLWDFALTYMDIDRGPKWPCVNTLRKDLEKVFDLDPNETGLA